MQNIGLGACCCVAIFAAAITGHAVISGLLLGPLFYIIATD